MRFNQVPQSLLNEIVLGKGMLLRNFDVGANTFSPEDVIAATAGGTKIEIKPKITDYSKKISNMPDNSVSMLKVDFHEATMSGKFASQSADVIKNAMSAEMIEQSDRIIFRPFSEVKTFEIWWVGDYSIQGDQTGVLAIRFPCAYQESYSIDGSFKIHAATQEGSGLVEVYMKQLA